MKSYAFFTFLLAALLSTGVSRAQGFCPPQPEKIIALTPRNCAATECRSQVLNGSLSPASEYPDAYRSPLQDFGGPMPDGFMHAQLDGEDLQLGFQLSGTNQVCGGEHANRRHKLEIYLDFARPDACGNVVTEPDDRKIEIAFEPGVEQPVPTTASMSVLQFLGGTSGGWTPIASTHPFAHPLTPKFVLSNGTSNTPKYFVELRIRLNTNAGIQAGVVPRAFQDGRFGLGVKFESNCNVPGMVHRVRQTFPNRKSPVVDANAPSTWAKVLIAPPTPTPVFFNTYNAGQMPSLIANGGTGEPGHFAFIAATTDNTCFQELWAPDTREAVVAYANFFRALLDLPDMWTVGRPRIRDGLTDLVDTAGNPAIGTLSASGLAVSSGTVPGVPAGIVPITVEIPLLSGWLFADEVGLNHEEPGLLFLSSRPIVKNEVREFSESLCVAEDCLVDKGFIWARVLTSAADPPPARGSREFESQNPTGWDGSQFIDMFCTHLQNDGPTYGDATTAKSVRNEQIRVLREQADVLRARDRPAIMMGDFNINGNKLEDYRTFLDHANLDTKSAFDTANSTFSDRYDLGEFLPFTTFNPADVFAANAASGFATSIGKVTNAQFCQDRYKPTTGSRVDYMTVLPPLDPVVRFASADGVAVPIAYFPGEELNPFFGTSGPNVPGLLGQTGPCLSDHAALTGFVNIVPTVDPAIYDPAKPHTGVYSIDHVEALAQDGCLFCGAPDLTLKVIQGLAGSSGATRFIALRDDDATPPVNFSVSRTFVSINSTSVDQVWVGTVSLEDRDNFLAGQNDPIDVTKQSGPGNVAIRDTQFAFRYTDGTLTDTSMNPPQLVCDQARILNCTWPTMGTEVPHARIGHQFELFPSAVHIVP